MQDNRNSFVAFLVACFVVVGLAGIFVSYAAPVPYQRAFARLAALRPPGQAPQAFGSTAAPAADTVPEAPVDTPAARRAIIADAEEEAGGVLIRVRVLLAVLTVLCTLFGTGVMLMLRRQAVAASPVERVR